MTNQHRQRAVVDRVEGSRAVLLVGDDEVVRHVDVDVLPEGAGEGSILEVRLDGEEVIVLGPIEEGDDGGAQLTDRLDRLRRRRPSSRLHAGAEGDGGDEGDARR